MSRIFLLTYTANFIRLWHKAVLHFVARLTLCLPPLINRGAFGMLRHVDALLKVYRLRLSARYGRRLPKRIRLFPLHRVSACCAALTSDV